VSQYTAKRHKSSKCFVRSQDTAQKVLNYICYDASLDVFLFRSTTCM